LRDDSAASTFKFKKSEAPTDWTVFCKREWDSGEENAACEVFGRNMDQQRFVEDQCVVQCIHCCEGNTSYKGFLAQRKVQYEGA